MKLRTTLIVLLIGLAAWLAVKYLGEPAPPAERRAPLVTPAWIQDWEEIELKLYSGERMKLVREPGAIMIRFGTDHEGNQWVYRDPADPDHVEQLLRALQDCWREPLQGSADDVLRMGLDPPRMRITLRGKAQELDVGFGNDDPTGQGILTRSYGENTVFRTGRQVANLLEHNLDTWRTRTVFGFDTEVVNQVDLVRYPEPGPGGETREPEMIVIERVGNTWRMQQPHSLKADASACQSLIQRATTLKVDYFISQKFDETVTKISGLPDHPIMTLGLTAGPFTSELEIGGLIPGRGYAARMSLRDPNLCFTLDKAAVESLFATTVDSLRPRRLWPVIDRSLVAVKCDAADGTTRFAIAREGEHPLGAWSFSQPFKGRAHDGKGTGSFGQVVADLDRVEVAEFLPADTPFTPQATLHLKWKQEPILRDATIEIAVTGGKTLVRDKERPDELFAVSGHLAQLLDLDPQLFRDRTLFPEGKISRERVVRAVLEWGAGRSIGFESSVGPGPKEAHSLEGTPAEMVPKLQNAVGELYGAQAMGYVRAKAVAGTPLDKPLFKLTLTTADGPETLVVGAEGPEGHYCRLTPRLPDDVWIVVPRPTLQPLIRMTEE